MLDWKNLDHSAHAVGQNCFHFTWTPKFRFPVFRFPNYVREMDEILRAVARRHGIAVHELCIEPDHVHMFAGLPPTLGVSQALGLLKGASSFEFRKKHPSMYRYKALWSKGKFYRSIGSVHADAVFNYINDTHHTTRIPASQQRLTAPGLASEASDGNLGL